MKRIVTLFLVLTMMLCLVACGGKGGDSTPTTTEDPGNGIVYTGELDGEASMLSVKGNKAHFSASFTETEAGLTMKADTVRIGVITSNTNGTLVIDFFTEGAAVKVKMEITGTNADTYLSMMKEMMLEGADLSSDEEEALEAYFDGEMITVDYGSALWGLFADESDEAYDTITVTIDDTAKTFTQLVEDEK